jgi:hypothetical protein
VPRAVKAKPSKPAGAIRFLLGIRGRGKARSSEVQSVLFPKLRWTAERARAWLREHKMKTPAAEAEGNYLRFRQLDPGLFHSFASMSPGRKNPDAAALFEAFHGRPAERITEYTETLQERAELAELGRLIELVVARGQYLYRLKISRAGVKVTATPEGGQLYFTGGDQSVDLAGLDIEPKESATKDHLVLGDLAEIMYHTTKAFHNFEPIDYRHIFGDEGGSQPTLCYDQLNKLLYVVGGSYQVRRDGIVG